MRVVFADDEPLACDLMRALLGAIPDVTVVGEAHDGDALLSLVEQLQPDLVITDIEMPGRSGMRAAFELGRLAGRPELIFVTAHPAHGAEAFEVEAADYVLKPIRSHRLQQAVERARRRMVHLAPAAPLAQPRAVAAEDGEIWAPIRTGKARVRLCDVTRIQAAKDHAFLYTDERSYLLRITMGTLEAKLANTALRRVHRSAFVRLANVREVRRDRKGLLLVLSDGAVVPVGGTYRSFILGEIGHLAKEPAEAG